MYPLAPFLLSENVFSKQNPQDKPALEVHEWLAIAAAISTLLVITLATCFNGKIIETKTFQLHQASLSEQINILVEGAVKNPGPYLLPSDSTLLDALMKADPLPQADLRRLKTSKKLRSGQTIKVPSRPMMTVFIEGAVEKPGTVSIPKNSRLKDLKKYIVLQENADFEKLPLERILKANAKVSVPQKAES